MHSLLSDSKVVAAQQLRRMTVNQQNWRPSAKQLQLLKSGASLQSGKAVKAVVLVLFAHERTEPVVCMTGSFILPSCPCGAKSPSSSVAKLAQDLGILGATDATLLDLGVIGETGGFAYVVNERESLRLQGPFT